MPDVNTDTDTDDVVDEQDVYVESETDTDDAPPAKTYSKEEVDKQMAALRKTEQRKAQKAAKKRETELLGEIESLKTQMLKSLGAHSDASADDSDDVDENPAPAKSKKLPEWEIALRKLERKSERELKAKEDKLASLEAQLEKEKATRRDLLRSKLLDDALDAAGGVVDRKLALRYFSPQVVWDEDTEEWLYKTDSGDLTDISDGVILEMPEHLKPSKLRAGGSGTNKTKPAVSRSAVKTKLDEAIAELAVLEKRAKGARNGSDPVIEQWDAKRREVEKLKNQLRDTK